MRQRISLYRRLQSYSPRPEKNPKEDFFTEALVHLVDTTLGLHQEYVKFLAELAFGEGTVELDGSEMQIDTQSRLKSGGRPDVRIAVYGEDDELTLCIICEHKLEASEGWKQLLDYMKELEKVKAERKILAYITYDSVEQKSIDGVEKSEETKFLHLRWSAVYGFLKQFAQSHFLENRAYYDEFLIYMQELKMDPITSFSSFQIAALNDLPRLIVSMDACFSGAVWDAFSDIPPVGLPRGLPKVKQIKEYERWGYYKKLEKGLSWVMMGFTMNGEGAFDFAHESFPEVYVWLESDPGDDARRQEDETLFTQLRNLQSNDWQKVKSGVYQVVIAHKSMTDFIKEGENQIEAIQTWLLKRLEEVKKLLEKESA